MLEAKGLTVRLGGQSILREVDLEVRSGELLGLIGPNGAGKTTLMETLAGLLPARRHRPLLEHTLDQPVSGRVGLWSKADSVGLFDACRVAPPR